MSRQEDNSHWILFSKIAMHRSDVQNVSKNGGTMCTFSFPQSFPKGLAHDGTAVHFQYDGNGSHQSTSLQTRWRNTGGWGESYTIVPVRFKCDLDNQPSVDGYNFPEKEEIFFGISAFFLAILGFLGLSCVLFGVYLYINKVKKIGRYGYKYRLYNGYKKYWERNNPAIKKLRELYLRRSIQNEVKRKPEWVRLQLQHILDSLKSMEDLKRSPTPQEKVLLTRKLQTITFLCTQTYR